MSVPVARLDCTYDTKRHSGDKERTVCYNHFNKNSYDKHTDICVGAKVAIFNVNFLPEIGLYNRAIGDVCEDSYMESLCCDLAFAHKKKFHIFKFPKRFLEIS